MLMVNGKALGSERSSWTKREKKSEEGKGPRPALSTDGHGNLGLGGNHNPEGSFFFLLPEIHVSSLKVEYWISGGEGVGVVPGTKVRVLLAAPFPDG